MSADLMMHSNHQQCIGVFNSIKFDCLAQSPDAADASIHSSD